jgi:hypothetical protein
MELLHLEGGATRPTLRGRDVLPRNPDQALSTSAYPQHDVLSDSSGQRYVRCGVGGCFSVHTAYLACTSLRGGSSTRGGVAYSVQLWVYPQYKIHLSLESSAYNASRRLAALVGCAVTARPLRIRCL